MDYINIVKKAKMINQVTNFNNQTFPSNLSELNLETEYRSLKENPVQDFYQKCLLNANRYKRATGFFKSTVYSVIGEAIIEFARRGGYTELICSPALSEEDILTIEHGYAQRNKLIENNLVKQIQELLSSADQSAFNTRVLATLISIRSLDVKLAIRADQKGLYHEKIGIFLDSSDNAVSFKGSANETWNGWHMQGNFESIEVFCSWREGSEPERVKKHIKHFDTLWSEHDRDIQVFPFPDAALKCLKKAAFKSLDNISNVPNTVKKSREPLPHQEEAVKAWLNNNGRGIFEHATGSGKTYTALIAITQHIKQGLPALIVVPNILLLKQWKEEIKKEIPRAILLLAGDSNNKWEKRLQAMTSNIKSDHYRITLSTMQTASTPKFRKKVIKGEHLLLVADEVHQIGSTQHSSIMEINAGHRLGLSATPERYNDPDGTKKIFDYFGGIIPPRITIADAIQMRRLVPYEYFPHPLNLSKEELNKWQKYTKKISVEIARQKSDNISNRFFSENQKIKTLLIQRSRVAKKASAKIQLAPSVIKKYFEEKQKWLVYCEDIDQLQQVLVTLREEGITSFEYHSGMEDNREEVMSKFRIFGGVLVSIKCLDEGVDIPDVSHALILASSQNPCQFIQRRGRVLRRVSGKQIAVIHDAIVVPTSIDSSSEQASLLKSELLRAIEFADHALNKGANAELRKIAINMGINPDSLIDNIDEEEV